MEEEARKPIAYRPRALDGGYGWVVVLGLFTVNKFGIKYFKRIKII